MSFDVADIEAIMVEGREIGIDAVIDIWIAANLEVIGGWIA